MKKTITSEAVTNGHPDKICDQISDAILDAYLKEDPSARVACETVIYPEGVLVIGEITSTINPNLEELVRQTLVEIGYDDVEKGLDGKTCLVEIKVHPQSEDIACGVNLSHETGAGDQGVMIGYATNETPEYLPLSVVLANRLVQRLVQLRTEKILPYLYPDGKVQVTIEYEEKQPVRISSVVVAAQHDSQVSLDQLRSDLKEQLLDVVLPKEYLDADTEVVINGTGRFVIGGPRADTGLTGRKLMVDNYGPSVPHGGGAFSGKDGTKVDRTGAYYARYVAKNILMRNFADQVQITLCYAIGGVEPLAVEIDTFGTLHPQITEEELRLWIFENFNFSPKSIIEELQLQVPIYQDTAFGGHFGRNQFLWEQKKETKGDFLV